MACWISGEDSWFGWLVQVEASVLLLVVGCGWRPVEGDEEDVGCVEAETPLLGGGDEDGGDGNLGLAGVATTMVGSGLWIWRGKSDEVRGVDGRAKGGALFCRLGLEDERKWGGWLWLVCSCVGELWLGVAAAFRSAVIRDFGEEAENSKSPKQGFLWNFF